MHVCMCPKSLLSSLTLQPYGLQPVRLLCPWHSPGKNTGMGCRALLQGIFPTQGSNPHLLNLPTLAREFFITSTTWEAGSKNENHKDIPERGMKNPSRSVFSKLLLFSRSAVYDSLRPHGRQHAKLPVLHHLPNLLKLTSIESGMLSDHLILCRPFSSAFNPAQHQGLFW